MAYLFPRFALAPVRCVPVRHEIAPLWSLFDDATRQIQQFERQTRRTQFNPRFDVKEDKESYVLEGEVPGFKESDLSIEWKDNVLAIRGQHESVIESGKKPEVEQAPVEPATIPDAPESDTSSIKSSTRSYQATVEDEEVAANASAVAESSTAKAVAQPTEQAAPVEQTTTPTSEPGVQHWISERRSGRFSRQFTFPSNAVNHEAIKASLESGILKIVVPKAPAPESRHIFIE